MTTSMQNPTLTRLCRPCDSFRTHRKNVKPETEISEGDEDVSLFQNIYRIFDLSSESKLFFYIQIGVIWKSFKIYSFGNEIQNLTQYY